MSAAPLFALDDTFVRELNGLYEPWQAAVAPDPQLLLLDEALASELGLDVDVLRSADGVRALVGNAVTYGAMPVAQAYSGHQFGGFSPRLGDGRALLLGELIDMHGVRRDLHLKGSGRTPFSRGGDGKAAVGPMLREFVMGEAMHALGTPTTRALAVVATGERIDRETMLPGAVLVRVASSHLRVGTFQFAAAQSDPTLLPRLANYAIARHYPDAASAEQPYVALLEGVVDAQASLIARWMLVGFIHGVMNTDNMTISGETIDYGPCAFMDAYDPATVFSSIDHGGRYAFGNQPRIAQWNLARFAESLLPLLADDADSAVAVATGVLQGFTQTFHDRWLAGMLAKLGIVGSDGGSGSGSGSDNGNGGARADGELVDDLLSLMHDERVDFTSFFRSLSNSVLDPSLPVESAVPAISAGAFGSWSLRWQSRLAAQGLQTEEVAARMDALNPIYIPRNHLVEEALSAGTDGDLEPIRRLLDVLAQPFTERPGLDAYASPPLSSVSAGYRTFCGT